MDKKIIIISGVLIVVLLLGGFFLIRSRSSQNADSDLTPTPDLTLIDQEMEPTDEPEYEREDFSIKVLNGTSVAGLAGKLKNSLTEAGFNVPDQPGNADNSNYTTTIIQAKTSVPSAFIEELTEELSGTYDDIDTEELDEDEETDVIIIIGTLQEQKKETSPTTAPTASEQEETPTPEPTTEE